MRNLEIITSDDLRILKNEIISGIKKEIRQKPTSNNTRIWLTPKEAAKYLRISERTLQKYKSSAKIKSYKRDGIVRYLESDLNDFLTRS